MKGEFNVLLVDDDEVSNFLNSSLLQELSVPEDKIRVATNGLEALDLLLGKVIKAGSQNSLLIILDLKMPVMDGFEFLQKFQTYKELKQNTDIYLLTSSNNPKDVENANRFNICGYIKKPMTKEALQTILKSY